MMVASLLAIALLSVAPAAASGPGTTSAEFLQLGVGARQVAMGQAFVGLADDVNAVYYNPAGLATLPRQEATVMHDEFADGVHHEWLAYALPTSRGAFALSADALYVEPFAGYDQFDRPIGNTSSLEGAYAAAYAFSPLAGLSFGASAKLLRSRLDTVTAQSAALDAGVLWRPWREVGVGAALTNAGPGLRYINETSPIPTTGKLGVGWTPYESRGKSQKLTFAVDLVKPRDDGASVSGGLELTLYDAVTLRAGGRSGQSAGTGLSFGGGLAFNRDSRDKVEVAFDYALVDLGGLTQAHRASLTLKFGAYNEEAREPLEWDTAPARRASRPSTRRASRPLPPASSSPSPRAKTARHTAAPSSSSSDPDNPEDLLKPLIWVEQ